MVKDLWNHPIRSFALICVAIIAAYVMWMGYRINEILSGPGWCATALGAGKASSKDGAPIKGLEACVGLLTIQLKSLATNSHILFGVVALCLLVLVVIVLAGARLSGKGPGGIELDISRGNSAAQAADKVAGAAVQTAEEIKHPPVPDGPHMPEPPSKGS